MSLTLASYVDTPCESGSRLPNQVVDAGKRQAHLTGDLLVGQSLEVLELEGLPLQRRHLGKSARDDARLARLGPPSASGKTVPGEAQRPLVELETTLERPPFRDQVTYPVSAEGACDLKEPRTEAVRILELRQSAERSQEGLLAEILGLGFASSQETPAEAENGRFVRLDEGLERRALAGEDSHDAAGVGSHRLVRGRDRLFVRVRIETLTLHQKEMYEGPRDREIPSGERK